MRTYKKIAHVPLAVTPPEFQTLPGTPDEATEEEMYVELEEVRSRRDWHIHC